MNWEEIYQKGEVFWNKGEPLPPMKQYLAQNKVRGRTLVPGCGHGHELALAVEHGLDAMGLDIAPTPYPLSVAGLTAFFADGCEIVADYVPEVAFRGREGREGVRVLRRTEQ